MVIYAGESLPFWPADAADVTLFVLYRVSQFPLQYGKCQGLSSPMLWACPSCMLLVKGGSLSPNSFLAVWESVTELSTLTREMINWDVPCSACVYPDFILKNLGIRSWNCMGQIASWEIHCLLLFTRICFLPALLLLFVFSI